MNLIKHLIFKCYQDFSLAFREFLWDLYLFSGVCFHQVIPFILLENSGSETSYKYLQLLFSSYILEFFCFRDRPQDKCAPLIRTFL